MPTSSYMVDLKVEIAFNAGYLTAAASRTWTDVSTYVELDQGLTITIGRQDERSQADANHLTLTLENDGRFTPGNVSGAYYPNVLLNRPIRVTGTPVDGAAQVEFLGFIDEWPVSWTLGTDSKAFVTVSASSRLSRLGTQAALSSIISLTWASSGPFAHYALGEPTSSLAVNDSSGNVRRALPVVGVGNPVTFGSATGPGTDGLTAAQFAGGQYIAGDLPTTATAFTLEFFFLRNGLPGAGGEVMLSGPQGTSFSIGSSGLLVAGFQPTALVGSSTSVADNHTHHAALTYSAGSVEVFLDGVSIGTNGAIPVGNLGPTLTIGASYSGGQVFNGVLSHVAYYESVLTAATILAHYKSGATGFAGETTSARLVRYAGYAGILSAEVSAETGQTTVQHVDTTDKQPVELMRIMETTEGGVLFDGRDGLTYFQNRTHRLNESSLFSLNMSQHMVESDYLPKLDRTALFNDVTAQDISGQFTAHVIDTQSRNTDNGVATASIETASQDDDEPLFLASWMVYKYKQPAVRIPTLTVNCLAQVGKTPNCSAVLAANVGDKITASGRPSQDSSSSASFFVEGYTRVYNQESCFTTFNVSSSSPDDTTYICGDSSRGVIGTNPIAL